jgi:nucleoside 2-deoxyribosyltransferase
LVYVIGAYSGDVDNNIKKAEDISIMLIKRGYHVITPHKNTSGYEKYEDGETITHQTWIDMDINILSRCDAVFIMNNSDKSYGSQIEIDYAKSRNLPEIEIL